VPLRFGAVVAAGAAHATDTLTLIAPQVSNSRMRKPQR
jgi:hypothetical protein